MPLRVHTGILDNPMTSYEKIKYLHDQGRIDEAKLVFAREYLGDGPRRIWRNILKFVTGKLPAKEIKKDINQRMKEIRELAKLLF